VSDYDNPEPPPSRVGGCLVQAVTHAVALALGAVLGIVGASMIEYYQNPELLDRPEGELSRAELISRLDSSEKAYAELLAEKAKHEEDAKGEVEAANQKVGDLQSQVEKKQEEMAVLEAKVKKSAGKSAALKKELEAKQAELDALQGQLTQALAEKAQLEVDLQISRQETDVARGETTVARNETNVARNQTIEAKWLGFKSDAMVQICEKGNRNKLAKCREAVTAALTSARGAKFKRCLSSGQASPRLIPFDKKKDDPELPRWSEWVDQESSFTEDRWYIVFCDPTLPEADFGSDAGEIEDLGL
jgi:predicted  nucleic acid-binding Zn-ribbon protein